MSTAEITEITEYSALGGGTVIHDGNNTVDSRGICWNLIGNPTIDMDMFTSDGAGLGEFVSEMETLMPGTTYYVRAYATNMYDTAYGEEVSFVTIGAMMDISVENLPDFGSVGMGSCSIEASYTVSGTNMSDDIMIFAPMGFQVAIDDTRILNYTDMLNIEQVNGEVPETTVYVRFCPDMIGDYDDFIMHFTINSQEKLVQVTGTGVVPPTLNLSVTELPDFGVIQTGMASASAMYSVSGIDLLGEVVITAPAGFEISLTPERGLQNRAGSRNRAFSNELILVPENGMVENMIYARFLPQESGVYMNYIVHQPLYGEPELLFVSGTGISLPEVETAFITGIDYISANCGGEVVSDGNLDVTARGICWSTEPDPDLEDLFTVDGEDVGTFTSFMGNLSEGTSYYVRAYPTNSLGTAYGNQMMFTTLSPPEIELPESFSFAEDEELEVDFEMYLNDDDYDQMYLTVNGGVNISADIEGYMVTFTASENWYGSEILTFIVSDNVTRAIAVDDVEIIVTPVNDAPTIELPESFTFAEDGMLEVDFVNFVNDVDNVNIMLSVSGEQNLQVEISDLDVIFTASENWFGSETLTFTVDDQQGRLTASDEVEIIVTSVNDLPIADAGEEYTGQADVTGFCEIMLNGSGSYDIDGEIVSWLWNWEGGNAAGEEVLAEFAVGTTEVTLTVSDNEGEWAEDNTFVIVTEYVNLQPVAVDDEYVINEDDLLNDNVFINDYDPDEYPQPITAELVSDVTDGVLNLATDGSFTYQPATNWYGSDSFIYRAYDGIYYSNWAYVTITVIPINDPPVINLPESFTFMEDGSLVVDFDDYVHDVDNVNIILSVSGEQNLQVEISDLDVIFTAAENWYGSETLTFTIDDQQGRLTASDEVEIIVTSVNDLPIADAGEEYTGQADVTGFCEILLNGTGSYDIDGEIVSWLWTWEGGSANGEEVITLFPVGTTEVTLTVTDNEGEWAEDNTFVIVTEYVNLQPVAVDDEYVINEDDLLNDNVFINDYDPDEYPQPITAELVSDVTDGVLNLAIDGSFTYQPAADWYGSDSFIYRAYDGIYYSNWAYVTITVIPINDPPVINLPESFTFAEDGVLEVDFVDYASDVDNVDLVLTVTGGSNIIADINGLMVTFTGAENWFGSETLSFTIDDQQGRLTASDEVEIIVTSVNDLPIASAGDEYTGQADVTGFCEIMLNGSGSYDIDGEIVSWEWSWDGGNAAGEEVMAEFPVGTTEVTLTVTDNESGVDTDITQVLISGYDNLAPVAIADEYSFNEDTELSDNVMANDYDPDESPLALIAELVSDVTSGTLELAEYGDFTYLPNLNWNGIDNFFYRVYDGEVYSETVIVTLIVNPVNDAPTIELPDSFTFMEDGSLEVDFDDYVHDVDNVNIILSVSGEQNLQVEISDFNVIFTASENWFGTETLTFTIDDQQGRLTASDEVEIIVSPSGLTVISKEIIPGWNWFSLNVTADDMSADNVLASLGNAGTSIKSQTQSSIYYDGMGWFGSLNECDTFTFYKLDANNNAIWEFAGSPVDVGENVYNLTSGWNWISYAPQTAEDINFALAQLGNNGSNIKSQTQSSINYDGIGWFGSLSFLQPQGGYMLQMDADQEFIYPLPAIRQQSVYSRQSAEAYDDCNPHAYEFNAVLIASSDQPIAEDSRLIACCKGETRSICQILDYTSQFGRKFYSLMLYSNEPNEADFQLYYQESADSKMIEVSQQITFLADMTMGDFINPFIVNMNYSDTEDVLEPQKMLTVYPNPFNPSTTIELNLETSSAVVVEIYNVKGQKVANLLDTQLTAGKHAIQWNAEDQSSGIYLLNVRIAQMRQIRKIILMK
ncbi:MAG: Ig-like domain-containing protein [Candidatus Stygibacter frigidus]|nr:Ig-like domain-containing protein [Candidatus Stygibacter frigidus]